MSERLSLHEILRLLISAVLAVLVLYLLYRVRAVLSPFIFAVLLAYLLKPVVRFFERWMPRNRAIAFTYILVGTAIALLLLFILPGLLAEMVRLAANIPQYITQVQYYVADLEARYGHMIPPELLTETAGMAVTEALRILEHHLANWEVLVYSILGVLGNLVSIIVAPILAAYLLRDSSQFRSRFYTMLPPRYKTRIIAVLDDCNRVLSGFLHGYLLVSLIVGIMATVILAVLGVRFYLLLGIVAGMTNLIPYFGPFIGAVPAVAMAAFTSWDLVIRVMIGYFILQQLESMVISPRIVGGKTGLHPLLVVLAVMAGGSLMGLPGLILGVPMLAISKVLVEHLLGFRKADPGN